MTDYIDRIFLDPAGPLHRIVPEYKPRQGQVDMARIVNDAVAAEKAVIIEAPTGIGKTWASLVPPLYHRKSTLVVTASISLQEQLVNRDVPFLAQALERPVSVAIRKGRRNYICRRKAWPLIQQTKEVSKDLQVVFDWIRMTDTGDRSELEVPFPYWDEFSSSNEECLLLCPMREDCFYTQALRRCSDANVVVTNYHVLFLTGFWRAVTICDEAHEMAQIARDVLGWSLRTGSLLGIKNWLDGRDRKKARDVELSSQIVRQMRAFLMSAIDLVPGPGERCRITKGVVTYDPAPLGLSLSRVVQRVDFELTQIKQEAAAKGIFELENYPLPLLGRKSLAERIKVEAVALRDRIFLVTQELPSNWTFWAENHGQFGASIEGRPLVVSEKIAGVFRGAAVVTSGTLRTSDGFESLRKEIGFPASGTEHVVSSPFVYRNMAHVVIPNSGVLPAGEQRGSHPFFALLVTTADELIRRSEGRTMCLFTSKLAMRATAEGLRNRGRRVLVQYEEMSNQRMVEALRDGEIEAILGTMAFWTGVDVPGPALSGLLIDKIPFDSMSDPLGQAMCELIAAEGGDAFYRWTLPRAVLKLRQGMGRLIRTENDRGLIVVCDARLIDSKAGRAKSYANVFKRSWPPFEIFTEWRDLDAYLASGGPSAPDIETLFASL